MYYAIGMSVSSLHRESTDSLIVGTSVVCTIHVYMLGTDIQPGPF